MKGHIEWIISTSIDHQIQQNPAQAAVPGDLHGRIEISATQLQMRYGRHMVLRIDCLYDDEHISLWDIKTEMLTRNLRQWVHCMLLVSKANASWHDLLPSSISALRPCPDNFAVLNMCPEDRTAYRATETLYNAHLLFRICKYEAFPHLIR